MRKETQVSREVFEGSEGGDENQRSQAGDDHTCNGRSETAKNLFPLRALRFLRLLRATQSVCNGLGSDKRQSPGANAEMTPPRHSVPWRNHSATPPRHDSTPPRHSATPPRHDFTPRNHSATPPRRDFTPRNHSTAWRNDGAKPSIQVSRRAADVIGT